MTAKPAGEKSAPEPLQPKRQRRSRFRSSSHLGEAVWALAWIRRLETWTQARRPSRRPTCSACVRINPAAYWRHPPRRHHRWGRTSIPLELADSRVALPRRIKRDVVRRSGLIVNAGRPASFAYPPTLGRTRRSHRPSRPIGRAKRNIPPASTGRALVKKMTAACRSADWAPEPVGGDRAGQSAHHQSNADARNAGEGRKGRRHRKPGDRGG